MPGTNTKVGDLILPAALGKVFPAASYATLSVPLTQNIVPCKADGTTPDNQFNGIWIQAANANSGTIYVCNTAAAPDTSAYTNIIGELTAGQWFPRTKEWANNRDISKLFIGAENATDFAIVSLDAF